MDTPLALILRAGGFPIGTPPIDAEAERIAFRAKGGDASKRVKSLAIFHEDAPDSGSPIRQRLDTLQEAYAASGSKRAALDANDRLSASAEANLAHILGRLGYAEWILPILGFIGTVWGVINAVLGLSAGIEKVFEENGLSIAAMNEFRGGFDGLALAFDTTLFGLLGLGIIGLLHFMIRRENFHQILVVDAAGGTAAMALQDDDLASLIRRGFFETDDEGELLVDDDSKPVLRWQAWMDLLRDGMLETDEQSKLKLDEDGKPTPRWQSWMLQLRAGLFETDENGALATSSDDKPVPRWQQWLEDMRSGALEQDSEGRIVRDDKGRPVPRWEKTSMLLLSELFYLRDDGEVLRDEQHQAPVSKWEQWRLSMMRVSDLILREVYELGGDEDSPVRAYLEGEDDSRPMRSRFERRHQVLRADLQVIQRLLLASALGIPLDEPGAKRKTAGERVLEPNECPCIAIAVSDHRYAVAREEAPDSAMYSMHTGCIASQLEGRFRMPEPSEALDLNEAVNGLAVLGDWTAGTCPLQAIVETRGPGTAIPNALASGSQDAELPPNSVALLHWEGGERVAFLTQENGWNRALLWRADGESTKPQMVHEGAGEVLAATAVSGLGLLWASQDGDEIRLILFGDSGKVEVILPTVPSSLALGPEGSIWVGDQTSIQELVQVGDGLKPTTRAVTDSRTPTWIAATAAGEVVTAAQGDRALHILSTVAGREAVVEYDHPITALAASASGSSLLVGCADGSAYYWDSRRCLSSAPPESQP